MADENIAERYAYAPGTTLGRAGYAPHPEEKLAERIKQLDALLMVLDDDSEKDGGGFHGLNFEIKRATIQLASSLATEIHELHEQTSLHRMEQEERVRQGKAATTSH